LGVFGIAGSYESQRVLEARGVLVDAVVVERENSLNLEFLAQDDRRSHYVASPDGVSVGDVVTIRYDPLDPTNFAPTMERGLSGYWVVLGALMIIMAGLWSFQTVELIGRLTGRRKRQPRNLGFY